MKYLAKYNEEVKWLKKLRKSIMGVSKKDMFITEFFPGPTVAEITKDNLFSGKKVPDLDLNILKDYYIKDISNKGVFVRTPEDYSWSQYKFKSSFNDEKNEMWYNQSHIFKRLKDISNKLGYKVGTQVYINNGKGSGVITDIVKFAFYNIGRNCNEVLTLLYKVGDIYYQITQIEKSDQRIDNIIDEVIKENFYELIDDNIVSYSSVDTGTMFECTLVIHEFSTSRLEQVSEYLSIASNRLKDSGIILEVEDIYKSNKECIIKFNCFKTKK